MMEDNMEVNNFTLYVEGNTFMDTPILTDIGIKYLVWLRVYTADTGVN